MTVRTTHGRADALRFPLRLRPARRDDEAPPTAWLIAGSDPAAWLREACRWGVATSRLRFLAVPRARNDVAARGALVIAPDGAKCTPRGLSYRLAAERLWVPCGWRLDPTPTPAELTELAAGKTLVVVPPALLVGYDDDDVLGAADLIAPPRRASDAWSRALDGPRAAERLRSVHLETTPDLATLDETLGHGFERPDDATLPPSPSEAGPLRTAGYKLARGLAETVNAMTGARDEAMASGDETTRGQGARADGGEGLFDKLGAWSARLARSLDERLRQAQHRELERLAHLLDTDPDRGLRHAIPLGGRDHRGVAPASDRLHENVVDFRLDAIGSGGPASHWDVPPALYARLFQQYVDAANRELAAGEHRRAAYVFSRLLGDHEAAANALAQGGFHREAAIIYRDHLGQPRQAAECLERGGLLLEAIEAWHAEGVHDRVGDLWERVGDREAARAAWYRAVSRLAALGDLPGASRVLEKKLDAPDDAFELLRSAWPDGNGARTCLDEALLLAARRGWHERAHGLVRTAGEGPGAPARDRRALQVLVKHARTYPDDSVRRSADDTARVVVSRLAGETSAADMSRLMLSLARLDPDDAQLRRDATLFASRRHGQTRHAPSGGRGTREAVLVNRFELPHDVRWSEFAAVGTILYAAGVSRLHGDPRVVVYRQTWDGRYSDTVEFTGRTSRSGLILAPDPRERHLTIVGVPGVRRELQVDRRTWPEVVFESGPPAVGMPSWLPDVVLGLGYTYLSTLRVLSHDREHVWLSHYGLDGSLLKRAVVRWPEATPDVVPSRCFVAGRDRAWMAIGKTVLWWSSSGPRGTLTLPGRATGLDEALLANGERVIVATFEGGRWDFGEHCTGAAILRPSEQGTHTELEMLPCDGARTAVALRDGTIAVLTRDELRIVRVDGRRIRATPRFRAPDIKPLCLLLTDAADEIAVATEGGAVCVYAL